VTIDGVGRRLGCWALGLALLLPVRLAHAENTACHGQDRNLVLLNETLLGLTDPIGVENQLAVYDCVPLIRQPGILFDLTSVEAGLSTYLAPIYVHAGPFVRVTPLSILRIKAEVMGVVLWPFILDGSAYFPVASYSASWRDADLPAAKSQFAGGLQADVEATLQAEIPFGDVFRIAVQDVFTAEYWRIGNAAYYLNPRRDLLLKRSDFMVKNVAALLASFAAKPNVIVRVGPIDDFTLVPASGYRAHCLGGIGLVELNGIAAGGDLAPFVRVDYYLEHGFRRGVNVFAGLSTTFELGASGH